MDNESLVAVACDLLEQRGFTILSVNETLVTVVHPSGYQITWDVASDSARLPERPTEDHVVRMLSPRVDDIVHGIVVRTNEKLGWARSVVMVIKPIRDVIAMIEHGAQHTTSAFNFVFDGIGSDLAMVAALDRPGTLEFVSTQHLSKWGASEELVVNEAFVNMWKWLPEVVVRHVDGGVAVVSRESHCSSSLVLIAGVRERLNEEFQGEVVFALPRRDLLLASRLSDDRALTALHELAAQEHLNGPHSISPDLFQMSSSGRLVPISESR